MSGFGRPEKEISSSSRTLTVCDRGVGPSDLVRSLNDKGVFNTSLIESDTMASQPILDLATINLDDEAVSKEKILELNAQRDEFEQLDRLISLDLEQGLAVGVKQQTADEFWTRGHIPGRPIMPGVLMIEMAAQISSVIYHLKFETGGKKFFGFGGVNHVKFRGSVEPGCDLIMVVRAKALRSRMAIFEAQGFVDGKMVFEGEVTGIVI